MNINEIVNELELKADKSSHLDIHLQKLSLEGKAFFRSLFVPDYEHAEQIPMTQELINQGYTCSKDGLLYGRVNVTDVRLARIKKNGAEVVFAENGITSFSFLVKENDIITFEKILKDDTWNVLYICNCKD